MAEQDCNADSTISKTQRRYKVGYVSVRHQDSRTCMTTYYNRHPSLHLKGDWLKEAEFGTDTPVIVAVEQGQLVIRPFVAE